MASTLPASPFIDPIKGKAVNKDLPKDSALRKEIGPGVGNALKSLGSAVGRKIRGEGVIAFSSDEKKQWWKEEKKFKIGLIKTSVLDKVINIYGETFDLSKRLSKEERKVFKGSCHYEDGLDVKEELDDANYAKAKVYGMNLKNDKGNPEVPKVVNTYPVMTTTDFEKLYLGWIYDPVKLANSVAADPGSPVLTALPVAPVAPVATPASAALPVAPVAVAVAPVGVTEDKKKLKVEVLKGLFRFVFGTAKINKVTKGLEKYRVAYTDFDIEEKIPCKGALWADFKKSLEYRREQAICELHSARVVIGTDFNQTVEQKTELCVGLADLISILDESPCFHYDNTEYPVEEVSTFSDEDYARALRVFDNFVNKEDRDSAEFKEALAGLRKPGNEPTPYGELYNKLVASLNALLRSDPQLQKENKDLRKVVGLLTGMLTISSQIFDLHLKAKELYCKIKGCCGKEKIEPADSAVAQETLDGYQDEIRRLTVEIERLRGQGTGKDDKIGELKGILDRVAGGLAVVNWEHDFANGAQALLRRVQECHDARDALVQVIQNIESLNPEDDAEAARLDALLQQAKASKEGFDAVIGELTAGLGAKAAFIGLRNPGQRLNHLRTAVDDAEREHADAAAARAERNAARAEAQAALEGAAGDIDEIGAQAAAARAEAEAARTDAAAARAEAAAARATGAEAAAAREDAAAARAEAEAARTAAEEARAALEAAVATATRERNAATANAATARGERDTAAGNAATARGERDTAAADAAVARREAEADRAAKAAADAAVAAATARAEAAEAGADASIRAAAEAASAEAARLREASAAADAAAAAARDDAAAARAETAAARAQAAADRAQANTARANRNTAAAAAAAADERAAAADERAAAATRDADERAAAANARAVAATAAIEAADESAAAANARAAAATAAIDASTADAAARVNAAEARAAAIEAAGGDAAAAIAAADAATRAAKAQAAAAKAAAAAATADAAVAEARAEAAEDAAATTAAAAAAAVAEAAAIKAAADAAAIADLTRNRNASAAKQAEAEAAVAEARAAIAAASAEAEVARKAAAAAAVAEKQSAAALAAAATAAAAANARADEEAEKAAAAADRESAATAKADAAAAAIAAAEARAAAASARGNAAERAAADKIAAAVAAAAAAAAEAAAVANKKIADANAAAARARGQAADAVAALGQHEREALEAAKAVAAAERQRADAVDAAIAAERERARLAADLARVSREKTDAERRVEGKDANTARIGELTDALAAANRKAAESGTAAKYAAAAAASANAERDRVNGLNGTIAAEIEAARAAAKAAIAEANAARAAAAATAASAAAEVQTQRGIAAAALIKANAAEAATKAAARAALVAASAAAERDTAAREAAAEAARVAELARAAAERAAAERAAAERDAERAAAEREAARAAEASRAAARDAAARVADEAARAAAERAAAEAADAAAAAEAERARPRSSTQQIAEVKIEAEVAKRALRDNKDEINAIINTFTTGEKKIRIAKLLLNLSQIAIVSLTNLESIKTPTFSAKYRYYIGEYKRQKKISELKGYELTEAIEKELFRLQNPEGIRELNKHFQALYWGEGKEGKGSVWTSNPETEVEFIINILDSMYKDFALLLLDNGSEPRDIISSLKLNSNIETSIDAAGLKKYEVILPIRTLLGLILNRAFANAKIAKGERIESFSTPSAGGGGASAGGAAGGASAGGASAGGAGAARPTYIPPRSVSRPRKQLGGSLDKSSEFYKSMLILILLKLETNSKEFLEKLKAAMRAAGQEDLVMDLLRRIIDKWLKVKGTEYTISFTDLDKHELEGLEEALKGIVLNGDSLHVEAPEEFRDALGDQPYFLVGEGDILHGLDEEVELEAEEKKALAGGIPLTAVLAMYLLGLVGSIGETFDELE